MNDIEAIKELYIQYWECMINKDESGLRNLMSDDYHLMHMTGKRQSVDEFISGLLDSTFIGNAQSVCTLGVSCAGFAPLQAA